MTIAWTLGVQIQLSTDGTTFADVTSDVAVVTPIDISIGIPSADVDAHTAQPGTASFYMKNADNGAGILGLYSPGNAVCLSGFEVGKKIRISADTDYLFTGWIDAITPQPGTKGPRLTKVDCSDWLKKAAAQKLVRLDVATAVKSETAAATIVGGVATAPVSTSYGVGQETFAYALDDCKDEKTTALTALDKVAKSEFGWIYNKADGTLRFDNRNARLSAPSWKHTFTEDEWQSLEVERSADNIKNYLEVTTNPRVVGTSFENLWGLNKPAPIAAGETLVLKGNFTDPNQQVARISAGYFPPSLKTTNYCKNPSFEANVTDDWTLSGAGATAVQDATKYHAGTKSAKVHVGTADASFYTTTGVSVPNNSAVTASAWMWGGAATASWVRLLLYQSGVGERGRYSCSTIGAWEYGSISWTNTTGAPVTIWLIFNPNYGGAAYDSYVDACLLELQNRPTVNYPTPYADPNTSSDWTWAASSDANNSISSITPVAGTDFNLSSGTADTGDYNADCGIWIDYGANSAEFQVTNNHAGPAYITKLVARGYAIRLYDPATSKSTDSDSIALYDKHSWAYDMPWQDKLSFGQSIADVIKGVFHAPISIAKSVTYIPDTQTLMDLAKTIAVGDGIKVSSPVNGISEIGYFVNAIHWSIKRSNNVTVTYTLGLSFVGAYWLLQTAGAGELDLTTWLGF